MVDRTAPPANHRFTELVYQCVTPLHVGCGQDVGIVDLPVIRERVTGYPYVPGSGVRGALRACFEELDAPLAKRLFGAAEPSEIAAGCVAVVDARLLLFPVRSAPGVFHWVTCPAVLARYRRDRAYFLGAADDLPTNGPEPGEAAYFGGSHDSLHLEEFLFAKGEGAWEWAFDLPDVDPSRVLLVSDEVFDHFVHHATVLTQRNRLSSVKTVVDGALFSLEAVPPEAVFYGFVGTTRERTPDAEERLSAEDAAEALRSTLSEEGVTHLGLGGDESTGLGLTRIAWRGGAS